MRSGFAFIARILGCASLHHIEKLSNLFDDVVSQQIVCKIVPTMDKPPTFPDVAAPAGDRLESQVYRQLLDQIRFGQFALGQKLPSENDLSEAHGVSRPVVRAALSKLRDSGLIVSRRGAGSFVSSGLPTDQSGFGPLQSVDDIAAYFEFRRTVEAESVERATQNAKPSDIKGLRLIVEEIRDRLAKGDDAVSRDIKFHTVIAELSDNRFLIETVRMLHPHWMFVGSFLRSLGMSGARNGKRMTAEHMRIVDAMASGDPKAARRVMLEHIDGSERRVFKGN